MDWDPCDDRVSIVVPTRDRMWRLQRTVRNLLHQTHPAVEIVVSDDGSTDGTLQLLDRIGDERLVVVSTARPAGVSVARNRGIAAATGHWVAVCDDDDLWHPDKLRIQVRQLRISGGRWGFCGAVSVSDDLQPMGQITASTSGFGRRLRQGNPVPGGCSSAIVERRLLHEVEAFDPQLSMFADYDLWIRLSVVDEPVAVEHCLVLYVEHEGQMTRTKVLPAIDELRRVRDKHPRLFTGRRDASIQSMDRWLVTRLRCAGMRSAALRYLFDERRAFTPSDLAALAARSVVARPQLGKGRRGRATAVHPSIEAVRSVEGPGRPTLAGAGWAADQRG